MSLTRVAIENRTVTYFATFLIFIAGIAGFFSLGQLEDPDFTIKTAVISTTYAGADPEEVELEVTDKIELAIQEMKQVKNIRSLSKAGLSIIFVDIESSFTAVDIPQIWDELRRKIRNVEGSLPPGVSRPVISDDFGDVYGHLLAVTGDGFSYAEIENYTKEIKKELSLVEGVARVDIWGAQRKVAYLDVSQTQLSQLGISDSTIEATLQQQNLVVDAGSLDIQNKRLRIAPSGAFQSVEDIADLPIHPSLLDTLNVKEQGTASGSSELIRIRDIGTVSIGYQEPPIKQMRVNGESGIALAVTNVPGVNIVDMGKAVATRLQELKVNMPIGLEVRRIHWQADVVGEAVSGFLINFLEAVLIVLVVLTIGMGWRLSLIIGIALIATILGSFMIMAMIGIDLQRMSLGALIIALGMMVDNAIVVADGIGVRLQKGMDRVEAAVEAATLPSIPLLGATVVAVMAFYPIYSSNENAGEYCATLFSVVAISLLVSWVVSVTLTPLQCVDMLKIEGNTDDAADPYASGFFKVFRGVLEKALRMRWLTMGVMVALLVASVIGFGQVKQLFFPDSSMTKFMIDYWAPEGTRVQTVSGNLDILEEKLLSDDRIDSVATFIGAGPPRFYLPVESEQPNSSYAQLIVNVKDYRQIDELVDELGPWLSEHYPDVQAPIRKFGVGPSDTWKFEVRISGPNNADPDVLRSLASEMTGILNSAPLAGMFQTDWRERVKKIVPNYNQERGRWAGILREDIANATKRAFDGRVVGMYRERDDLIPIVLRQIEEERKNVGALGVLQIQPSGSTDTVPLSQVTDGVLTEWDDPVIRRRDRRRTITVQANPIPGVTLAELRNSVLEQVNAVELPPGYKMEWGGEFESSRDSQASLIPGVIPAVAIIALIIVGLFNALRPPLIIALTIPFAVIGLSAGLLVTGAPFGFVALLAAMSLAGMMIKNAIVLLDEVKLNLEAGVAAYDAVIGAALSRVRPVVLAAATTVLGVIPLLQDVFWIGLAVVIMAGLSFGTVLTMIVVPVLYVILYRVKSPDST